MNKLYYLSYLLVIGVILISFTCKKENKEKTISSKDSLTTKSVIAKETKSIDLWKDYTYKERVGLRLYGKFCAVCHGTSAKGDGFNAYNLNPAPTNLADSSYMSGRSDGSLNKVISYGGLSMNKSVLMPAYENTLSSLEINSIISYLRKISHTGSQ